MTIVPLMVVADKIAGLKKIGTVPATATIIIVNLPFVTVRDVLLPRSTDTSLEKDANEESSVDAADVIMMKLIRSIMMPPIILLTSTAACPSRPWKLA